MTKYNGIKTFIPQYRNDDFSFNIALGIFVCPILFPIGLFKPIAYASILSFFFINWKNIPLNENWKNDDLIVAFSFPGSTMVCKSEQEARHIIDLHREGYNNSILEKSAADAKLKANKVKKTTYIQVD